METMATVTAFRPSKLLSSSCSFFSRALSHPSFPCRSASVQPRIRSRSTLRISAVSPRRRTLSEEWDLSNSVAAPGAFQIPSFEELDTTNMLLRQRIVFLGSQVFSHTDIYVSERIVVIFLSFSNNFHSLVCYLSWKVEKLLIHFWIRNELVFFPYLYGCLILLSKKDDNLARKWCIFPIRSNILGWVICLIAWLSRRVISYCSVWNNWHYKSRKWKLHFGGCWMVRIEFKRHSVNYKRDVYR